MSAIRRMSVAALALVLIALPARAATGTRYATSEVELGTFTRTSTLDASVEYLETQGISTGAQGALLGEILVAAGETVSAGDAVATYTVPVSGTVAQEAGIALSEAKDDFAYEMDARQAEIDSLVAQRATETDETEARILDLKIERAELTLARDRADGAARVTQLEAAYAAALSAGEPRTLTAGISGLVYSAAQSAPGEAIDASKLLVAVYNPQKVLVRVSDPEGLLKYGMAVDLKLSGGSGQGSARGTVVSADNVLPGELRAGVAYVAFDASKNNGYTSATVSAVTMRIENALIASPQAVSYDAGTGSVRILAADGAVHTRRVVKAMESGSGVWIALGVQDGDRLITK